ncbi:MAG: HAD-IC family P-type ATPase [Desulforhopalus sp.]
MLWYKKSAQDVLHKLDSERQGLSENEAKQRLKRHGPNRIQKGKEISAFDVFLHQFTSPLIYVLLGALLVTLSIQSWADATVIGAVLVINAVVGFIQEYQAESAVQSLMQMITPKTIVIRDGGEKEIDSANLVPGDIVKLSQGRMIPADVRLLKVQSLQVNESALTGESEPANKISDPLADAPDDLTTGDQQNMAFMGTAVTSGDALAIVIATGKDTKIGEIAEEVQKAGQIETPLERRIRNLTKWITVGILLVATVSSTIGWLAGRDLFEMILLGVALAVAAIPAGLPIVVTVALALGVRRMAHRHAVIRNLPAVDTLGSTTVIISDKTGTITQNQMTVRQIFSDSDRYGMSGKGVSLKGEITRNGELTELKEHSSLWYTLLVGCLCNDAYIRRTDGSDENGKSEGNEDASEKKKSHLQIGGDPMEIALLIAAGKAGLHLEKLRERYPRKDTMPFKTERRFMATFHESEDEEENPLVLVKGAPEKILEMCSSSLEGKKGELDRDRLVTENEALAGEGLRVLAMAIGHGDDSARAVRQDEARDLIFVGMQGMMDPPRPSAVEAVDNCHRSGIRVVMVTGDHARTASAIARKTHLGQSVLSERGKPAQESEEEIDKRLESYTGQQISRMDDAEFDKVLETANVFARVEPLQKLRLVNRLKENNEIVAVTGDGVNDAPALKTAHIGAAMGAGTDVAKDASDMVITDNNFASVYAAVREGRTAFRNIRMATFFLLSTGAADILIILSALVAGWPLPLLPAQILWCNVVTNGIADVALAFEPGEQALYDRSPRPPQEGVLNRVLLERLVLVGIWLSIGTLAMFWWKSGGSEGNLDVARTAALTTLVLFQKVHVFNCRSESVSIFKKSLLKNKVLFIGVLTSLGIHIAALYMPWTQELLRFTPLDGLTWAVAIGIALTAIIVNELHKHFRTPEQ